MRGYPLHSGAVSSLNLLKGESLLLAQPIPSSLNCPPPGATPSSPLEPVSVGPVPNSGECETRESVLEGAYDVAIDDRRESGWLSVKPGESQGRFTEAMAEENGQEEVWNRGSGWWTIQRYNGQDEPDSCDPCLLLSPLPSLAFRSFMSFCLSKTERVSVEGKRTKEEVRHARGRGRPNDGS